MGRRPLINQQLIDDLEELISNGVYIRTACDVLGISESVYYKYNKRGEAEIERREAGEEPDDDEQIYVEFVETMTRARARGESDAIQNIIKAANDGDWRAAAWFLERTRPRKYGKKQSLDVTSGGQSVDEAIARLLPGVDLEDDTDETDD